MEKKSLFSFYIVILFQINWSQLFSVCVVVFEILKMMRMILSTHIYVIKDFIQEKTTTIKVVFKIF